MLARLACMQLVAWHSAVVLAACGTESCTEDALAALAPDGVCRDCTCSSRIQWMLRDHPDWTENEACFQIAVTEYANDCGACAPTPSELEPSHWKYLRVALYSCALLLFVTFFRHGQCIPSKRVQLFHRGLVIKSWLLCKGVPCINQLASHLLPTEHPRSPYRRVAVEDDLEADSVAISMYDDPEDQAMRLQREAAASVLRAAESQREAEVARELAATLEAQVVQVKQRADEAEAHAESVNERAFEAEAHAVLVMQAADEAEEALEQENRRIGRAAQVRLLLERAKGQRTLEMLDLIEQELGDAHSADDALRLHEVATQILYDLFLNHDMVGSAVQRWEGMGRSYTSSDEAYLQARALVDALDALEQLRPSSMLTDTSSSFTSTNSTPPTLSALCTNIDGIITAVLTALAKGVCADREAIQKAEHLLHGEYMRVLELSPVPRHDDRHRCGGSSENVWHVTMASAAWLRSKHAVFFPALPPVRPGTALESPMAPPRADQPLVELDLVEMSCLSGMYTGRMLVVSFDTVGTIDSKQQQTLRDVQSYLHAHPAIEYVWWPSSTSVATTNGADTPSDDGTDTPHMRVYMRLLLFLGSSVLLQPDGSYRASFWGKLEAWLASQRTAAGGTRGLYWVNQQERRCTPAEVGKAAEWTSAEARTQLRALRAECAEATPESVIAMAWIGQLDGLVTGAFARLQITSRVWMTCTAEGDRPVLVESQLEESSGVRALLTSHKDDRLALVTVVGKMGSGKSYLLNCLLDIPVFESCNDSRSVTQGINLCTLTLPPARLDPQSTRQTEQPAVGFIDMQGVGDQSAAYNIKLMTPTLLVSRVLCFMWSATSRRVEREAILGEISQLLQAAVTCQQTLQPGKPPKFGHLHVVIRAAPADQTREALHHQLFEEGDETQRLTAASIMSAFASVTTWLMPEVNTVEMPRNHRDAVSHADGRRFVEMVATLRHTVAAQVMQPPAGELEGESPLTGGMLLDLMPQIVEKLNSSQDPSIAVEGAAVLQKRQRWRTMREDAVRAARMALMEARNELERRAGAVDCRLLESDAVGRISGSVSAIRLTLEDRLRGRMQEERARGGANEQLDELGASVARAAVDGAIAEFYFALVQRCMQAPIDCDDLDGMIELAQPEMACERGLHWIATSQRPDGPELPSDDPGVKRLRKALQSGKVAFDCGELVEFGGEVVRLEPRCFVSSLQRLDKEEEEEGEGNSHLSVAYFTPTESKLQPAIRLRSVLSERLSVLHTQANAAEISASSLAGSIEALKTVGVASRFYASAEETLQSLRAAHAALEALCDKPALTLDVDALQSMITCGRERGVPQHILTTYEARLQSAQNADVELLNTIKEVQSMQQKGDSWTSVLQAAISKVEREGSSECQAGVALARAMLEATRAAREALGGARMKLGGPNASQRLQEAIEGGRAAFLLHSELAGAANELCSINAKVAALTDVLASLREKTRAAAHVEVAAAVEALLKLLASASASPAIDQNEMDVAHAQLEESRALVHEHLHALAEADSLGPPFDQILEAVDCARRVGPRRGCTDDIVAVGRVSAACTYAQSAARAMEELLEKRVDELGTDELRSTIDAGKMARVSHALLTQAEQKLGQVAKEGEKRRQQRDANEDRLLELISQPVDEEEYEELERLISAVDAAHIRRRAEAKRGRIRKNWFALKEMLDQYAARGTVDIALLKEVTAALESDVEVPEGESGKFKALAVASSLLKQTFKAHMELAATLHSFLADAASKASVVERIMQVSPRVGSARSTSCPGVDLVQVAEGERRVWGVLKRMVLTAGGGADVGSVSVEALAQGDRSKLARIRELLEVHLEIVALRLRAMRPLLALRMGSSVGTELRPLEQFELLLPSHEAPGFEGTADAMAGMEVYAECFRALRNALEDRIPRLLAQASSDRVSIAILAKCEDAPHTVLRRSLQAVVEKTGAAQDLQASNLRRAELAALLEVRLSGRLRGLVAEHNLWQRGSPDPLTSGMLASIGCLRDKIVATIEDKAGPLKVISRKTAQTLANFLDAAASMLLRLADLAARSGASKGVSQVLSDEVRPALLALMTSKLEESYLSLLQTLNDSELRQGICDDESKSVALCWEALFDCWLASIMGLHAKCAETLISTPGTAFPHSRGTLRVLDGGELDPEAPAGLVQYANGCRLLQKLYFTPVVVDGVRTHRLWCILAGKGTLGTHDATFSNPTADHLRRWTFQTLTRLDMMPPSADLPVVEKWVAVLRAKALGSEIRSVLALLWLHLSRELLAASAAMGELGELDLTTQCYHFIQSHTEVVCTIAGAGVSSASKAGTPILYAAASGSGLYVQSKDFVLACIALQAELRANSYAPEASAEYVQTLERLSNSAAEADRRMVPEMLFHYRAYLRELRLLREKHLNGPYGQFVECGRPSLQADVLLKLQRLVQLTATCHECEPHDDSSVELSLDRHLAAVREAKDFATTYGALAFQPAGLARISTSGTSCEWQIAEWRACGEIIEMCMGLNTGFDKNDVMPLALKTAATVLPHFQKCSKAGRALARHEDNAHKDFRSASPTEEEELARSHFDNLLKACRGIFTARYETKQAFSGALELLRAHIDFNMSMPQLEPETAIFRFEASLANGHDEAEITTEDRERIRGTPLYRAHIQYQEKYEQCANRWLVRESKPVREILDEIRSLALGMDGERIWEPATREGVPALLATISFLLTLHTSKMISEGTGGKRVRMPEEGLEPLKMHIVQVLGVLDLLGIEPTPGSQTTTNKLSQVLTGQGKSWVLLALASVLAVTQHHVRILCHNESLTTRDRNAAEPFLAMLREVSSREVGEVTYATYSDTCWGTLDSTVNGSTVKYERLMEAVFNEEKLGTATAPPLTKDTVLLIDEVDVLFGPMYGKSFRPMCNYEFEPMAVLQRHLWQSGESRLPHSVVQTTKQRAADQDLVTSRLFDTHVQMLTPGMRSALSAEEGLSYQLGADGQVEHLVSMLGGGSGWSSKALNGYANAFHYLRLSEGLPRTRGPGYYGYLSVALGELSYAEVPKKFAESSKIFGVTGSLSTLPEAERTKLREDYRVSNFSYFPSFWGSTRNLEWDERTLHDESSPGKPLNFKVVDKEETVLNEALHLAKRLVAEERCVLIFCKGSEQLRRFHAMLTGIISSICILDSSDQSLDDPHPSEGPKGATRKDRIVNREAGEPAVVTLATPEFGRGEDFKMSPAVLERGGGHAIQLYLNKIEADDVQVRGRVARKSEPGSYTMLLSWDDVADVIHENLLTPTDAERATAYKNEIEQLRSKLELARSVADGRSASANYAEIHSLRAARAKLDFKVQSDNVKRAQERDQKSIALLRDVRRYVEDPRNAELRETIFATMVDFTTMPASGSVACVDLCLMMDCTGSMGRYIASAREKLLEVVQDLKEKLSGARVRVAYVGYRDFDCCDEKIAPRFVIEEFTEDTEKVKQTIMSRDGRSISVKGGLGVDFPEDVAGGLAEVNRLEWSSCHSAGQLNVTIMVANAPAHNTPQSGPIYHNFNQVGKKGGKYDIWTSPDRNVEQKLWMKTGKGCDDWQYVSFAEYPDSCAELKKLMAGHGSHFFFFSINEHTTMMSDAFRATSEEPRLEPSAYQHSKYVETPIGDANADAFKGMVVQAVEDAGTQIGFSR